jgi:xyloglucan-specific exo-beta-1,4-glucanase
VESDRVNANKFYGFNGGRFYVSTNGGATFTQTAATGCPRTGEVQGGAGTRGRHLARRRHRRVPLDQLRRVVHQAVHRDRSAISIGFGETAAPGKTYPALYSVATSAA